MDITEDFLSNIDGDSFFASEGSKTTDNNIVSNNENDKSATNVIIDNSTKEKEVEPILIGSDYPEEYLKIVNRIRYQYSQLPNLDYDSIYKEIVDLSIKSSPTPTLQVLSDELHRVQSAKDRLSEILIDVIKCYNFKNRAVDILKDSWGKFTNEKNTEGRKGDATFRLSDFMSDCARVEALFKACSHIFKNLDSLHDNLSRRITIWQLILKLRDVGRGAMPDFDFDKTLDKNSSDVNELFLENTNENEGGKKVELRGF